MYKEKHRDHSAHGQTNSLIAIQAINAAVANERERIAQMVERADNTMMKQDKLAAHIRNS